jgi:hypothetical protein
VRAPGRENAEIPVALMERSHMTTVIVGPMQPHAVDALLASLHDASSLPTWRCPNLLFMLPPSAPWIASKISAVAWPARLHVHVLNEALTSASSVWNAMLGMWNHVKTQPAWEPPDAALGVSDYPIKVADLPSASADDAPHVTPTLRSAGRPVMRVSHHALDATRAQQALGANARDRRPARLRGRRRHDRPRAGTREPRRPAADLDLSAAASAQVLRAHRLARATWACRSRSTR